MDTKRYSKALIAVVHCASSPPLLSESRRPLPLFLSLGRTLSPVQVVLSLASVLSLLPSYSTPAFPPTVVCQHSFLIHFFSFYNCHCFSLPLFGISFPFSTPCNTNTSLNVSLFPSLYSTFDMTVHLCSESHNPVNQSEVI